MGSNFWNRVPVPIPGRVVPEFRIGSEKIYIFFKCFFVIELLLLKRIVEIWPRRYDLP